MQPLYMQLELIKDLYIRPWQLEKNLSARKGLKVMKNTFYFAL